MARKPRRRRSAPATVVTPAVSGPTVLYRVPEISCEHCKRAIETEVATVPGVEAVEVDVAARTVRVEGIAPDDAIRAAIREAGYEQIDRGPA